MSDDPGEDQLSDLTDVLDLSPRLQGRPRASLHAQVTRDLTGADIAALAQCRDTKPAPLKRIRSSHHALARCLASGMKPGQAALVTGYDGARISVLQGDPAFAALVDDYRREAREVFADMAERMSNLSLDAIEILQERLHEAPEGFTIPILLDLIKSFADRTGHGPGQEVKLTMNRDTIDRPPRETFDEWQERRKKELLPVQEDDEDKGGSRAIN